MAIQAPDPFAGINQTLLQLLTQRQQNESQKEQLKIQQGHLKLEQERSQFEAQQRAQQDAASQAVLMSMIQQGDPTAQGVYQNILAQHAPAIGSALQPAGLSREGFAPGEAAAVLPTILQTQESTTRTATAKSQGKLAEAQAGLAQKELSSFDEVFALDKKVKEAQIARDQGALENDRRRTALAERELGLRTREFEASIRNLARQTTNNLSREYRATVEALRGMGASPKAAAAEASFLIYGSDQVPDESAVMETEMRFLQTAKLGVGDDRAAFEDMVRNRREDTFAERMGLSQEHRVFVRELLAQHQGDVQAAYNDFVDAPNVSDTDLAKVALYLEKITGKKPDVEKQPRKPFWRALRAGAGAITEAPPRNVPMPNRR